jgi:hypothetical protein
MKASSVNAPICRQPGPEGNGIGVGDGVGAAEVGVVGSAEDDGAADGDALGAPDVVGEVRDVGDAVGEGFGVTAGLGLVTRLGTGWPEQPMSEATSRIRPTLWTRFIGHVPHVRMAEECGAARAP